MRIEVAHATKHFGRVQALADVSFSITTGERVALVGPNGSGKSTLLRALLGLLRCDGRVALDGHDTYARRVETAKKLAYVPQQAPLVGATVRELLELITLTRELDHRLVESSAARFDLDLSAIGGRPFRYLSGGMKQKLMLAVAFASEASLLVLDEPTASLDARAGAQFFAACAELAPTTTVLLCSHRAQEVDAVAQRVIVLNEGRLVFDGPPSEYAAGLRPRIVTPQRGLP